MVLVHRSVTLTAVVLVNERDETLADPRLFFHGSMNTLNPLRGSRP